MKILMIGQHYYPDNFRINEISQELVRQGNKVDIITGLPDYATGKVPKEYRFFRRRRENYGGVQVTRVPVIARRTGSCWRALNYVSFMINSTAKMWSKKKDYDVIFCYQTSPVMMANAAIAAKRMTGKPLFLYCLDLWPESLKVWNVDESSILYRIMSVYSRHIYKNCDRIGVSSKSFTQYLVNVNQVQEDQVIYLPQHAEDKFPDIIGRYLEKETIDFVFAGNVGSVQDIECVIRAVAEIKKPNPIQVHILGDGSELENCKMLARDLNVENKVCFYGRLPREELAQYYLLADAFLLTLKGDNFVGNTMPGKLQEYMAIGKPVIAAVRGAAKEVIEEADCGIVVNPSDAGALASAMERLSKADRKLGENGRKYYEENFTKKVFIDNLLSCLKEM